MIGPAGTTAPVAGTVDTTCGAVGFAASPEATCVAPRIATVVIADIITGIPHQPGKRGPSVAPMRGWPDDWSSIEHGNTPDFPDPEKLGGIASVKRRAAPRLLLAPVLRRASRRRS